MKGIVLAGGLGTRMYPLTRVTNKHLLPVYDKPMIYYPIQTLVNAGIRDIMIVTGGNSAGDFFKLLKNGQEFGLRHLHYAYQEGEGGIAAALSFAEDFADGDKIVVILGDNLIEKNIYESVQDFKCEFAGAKIILKEVPDPQRFGVPTFFSDKIIKITEKPETPETNYAVIGIYMYDHKVFEFIKHLEPSGRGELEITDINNMYIARDELCYDILDGWWTDAGTFESLRRASYCVRFFGANKLEDIKR